MQLVNVINQITVSQTVVVSIVLIFIAFEITVGINKSIGFLFNLLLKSRKPLKSDKAVFDEIEKSIHKENLDPIAYFKQYIEGNPLNQKLTFQVHSLCDTLNEPHNNFSNKKIQTLKKNLHKATYHFSDIISINTTAGAFWKPWNEDDFTVEKEKIAQQKIEDFITAKTEFIHSYNEFVKGCKQFFRTLE